MPHLMFASPQSTFTALKTSWLKQYTHLSKQKSYLKTWFFATLVKYVNICVLITVILPHNPKYYKLSINTRDCIIVNSSQTHNCCMIIKKCSVDWIQDYMQLRYRFSLAGNNSTNTFSENLQFDLKFLILLFFFMQYRFAFGKLKFKRMTRYVLNSCLYNFAM
jgi:hypothetical protein